MEIRSLLTGRRGVSLPFSDYCEPILPGTGTSTDMMACLSEYGERAGWESIEVRGDLNLWDYQAYSESYCVQTLELT